MTRRKLVGVVKASRTMVKKWQRECQLFYFEREERFPLSCRGEVVRFSAPIADSANDKLPPFVDVPLNHGGFNIHKMTSARNLWGCAHQFIPVAIAEINRRLHMG